MLKSIVTLVALVSIGGSALALSGKAGTFLRQVIGTQSPAEQRWVEYRSPEGGYRVEMPGAPTLAAAPIESKDGRKVTNYYAGLRKGALEFIATHTNFPSGHLHPNRELVLDAMHSGMATGRMLVNERRLAVSGLPGRQGVVVLATGEYCILRVTVAGDSTYQVMACGGASADMDQEPDVKRFLDSFQLLPQVGSP